MASETYAPNPSNCILGAGKIYFDRFSTANAKQGFFEIGNAKDLKASSSQQRESLPNYLTPDGGAYAEGPLTQEITVSCLVYEFNRKNIALLASGTESTYTQATQTVSAATLNSSCALGAVYATAYRNITVTNLTQGTTTLATTDWQLVDATAGLIKILTTGAATEGTTVSWTGTAAAITGSSQKTVELYNAPNIYGQLLYVSNNKFGAQGEMRYWYTAVQQGDLEGIIGDGFGSSTLSWKVLNDASGTYSGLSATDAALSPYGRWYRR